VLEGLYFVLNVGCGAVADVNIRVVGSGVVVALTAVAGSVLTGATVLGVVRVYSSAQHRTPPAFFSRGAHLRVPVRDFTLEPKLV